jgi:transposase
MWKPEHRIAADRSGLRHPSDLTGAEWAVVEPMVPPAKHGGRKRTIDVREILNGIFYVLWTGCQWQALPKDLTRSMWRYASRRDGRRARPRRSSTARALRAHKKGGLA